MTDQEINAAIAEYCGWTNCRYIHALRDTNGIPPENWKGRLISGLDVAWIPNYCNDLNAMHEAEMTLPVLTKKRFEWTREDYRFHLAMIAVQPTHATARQRAEAFMKTIGKWEEQTNDN